jgi:hypothetical protein
MDDVSALCYAAGLRWTFRCFRLSSSRQCTWTTASNCPTPSRYQTLGNKSTTTPFRCHHPRLKKSRPVLHQRTLQCACSKPPRRARCSSTRTHEYTHTHTHTHTRTHTHTHTHTVTNKLALVHSLVDSFALAPPPPPTHTPTYSHTRLRTRLDLQPD